MAVYEVTPEMNLLMSVNQSDAIDTKIVELFFQKQKYINHIAQILAQFPIGMVVQKKRQKSTWEVIGIQAKSSKIITAKNLMDLPDLFIIYKLKKIESRKQVHAAKILLVNQKDLKEKFAKYLKGEILSEQPQF